MLQTIIKNHATDQAYRAVVFGSRATGRAQKYSDVDVALIAPNSVPIRTLSGLREALEDSSLPYIVDVVDYASASDHLQDEITRNGVELVRL